MAPPLVSCPYIFEQNGVSEGKHRHIVDTYITLLFNANFLLFLCVEAFMTVFFLIDKMITITLNMDSLFSKLRRPSSNYNPLKVFGCLCFPYLKGQ